MFEVSVIIPTFNESQNILRVINEIENNLKNCDYEIIVVDDNSPDGTADTVKKYTTSNSRVSCIKRTWKKGLSSAVVEGYALSTKKHICVIDGDGQHDPKNLALFVEAFENNEVDIVIGSRFLNKSETHGLSTARNTLSNLGIKITNFFLSKKVTDPLSGFFIITNQKFGELQEKLYKDGFKILFDLLMLNKQLRVKEVGINFRSRIAGESKLNISTVFNLVGQIFENISRGLIPANFVVFAFVGTLGVLVHLIVLKILLTQSIGFIIANTLSTLLAMCSNYFLNNYLTFHNIHRLFKERMKGLIKYCFANSFSILANIGVASQFYLSEFSVIASALFGILAGLILNYFLSVNLVFKK